MHAGRQAGTPSVHLIRSDGLFTVVLLHMLRFLKKNLFGLLIAAGLRREFEEILQKNASKIN